MELQVIIEYAFLSGWAMIKLNTLILIDFFNADGLDKNEYNISQHKKAYSKIAKHMEGICIETGITDLVYAAYGSDHELYEECTDLIFKDKALFPRHKIVRHSCYNIEDKPELFKDKGILVAGNSFWTCVRARDVGLKALLESDLPRDIWCAPEITGFYGDVKETTDSVFKNSKQPLDFIQAQEKDFRKDTSYKWRKVEITDNHSVYKCIYA